jgi:outer membrane protein assembly factor BamB
VAITPATIGSLRRRWTRGEPTVADTEALVRGSRAYIVTSSDDSSAILAARRTGDGSSIWTRTVPGRPRTPAIGTGRLFVSSETFGGSIVSPLVSAFDVDSGAPLWSVVPPFVPEAPLGGGGGGIAE